MNGSAEARSGRYQAGSRAALQYFFGARACVRLKSDDRTIFTATAHAQRAVDFLVGLQPPGEAALRMP